VTRDNKRSLRGKKKLRQVTNITANITGCTKEGCLGWGEGQKGPDSDLQGNFQSNQGNKPRNRKQNGTADYTKKYRKSKRRNTEKPKTEKKARSARLKITAQQKKPESKDNIHWPRSTIGKRGEENEINQGTNHKERKSKQGETGEKTVNQKKKGEGKIILTETPKNQSKAGTGSEIGGD